MPFDFLRIAPRDVLGVIDVYTDQMELGEIIERHCHQEAVHALARPGNQDPVTAELFSPDFGWADEPYLALLLMENSEFALGTYERELRPYVEGRLFAHYIAAESWLRYLFDFMAEFECDTDFFSLDDHKYTQAVREALVVGEVQMPTPPPSPRTTPKLNSL